MRSAMDKLSRLIGHLTVRQQIGAAAAALCVLIVAVIAGATGYLSARQADAFVRQDLAGTARVMSDQLDRTLSTRYREVRILASLEPLQPLWHTDAAQLRAVLEQLQLSYPDYSWIGFADLNGNVRAATGGMLEGASVKARPGSRTRCSARRSRTCTKPNCSRNCWVRAVRASRSASSTSPFQCGMRLAGSPACSAPT